MVEAQPRLVDRCLFGISLPTRGAEHDPVQASRVNPSATSKGANRRSSPLRRFGVIAGILIAFWLNEWASRHSAAQQRQERLERLFEEAGSTVTILGEIAIQ